MSKELRLLTDDEWPLIEPILCGQMRNGMPVTPDQSTFEGAFVDGKLVGHLHVEGLFHFNYVHIDAQYRQTGLALRLIRKATSRIPAGFSAIWLTDRNADQIARLMGWRNVGKFTVYRKDV